MQRKLQFFFLLRASVWIAINMSLYIGEKKFCNTFGASCVAVRREIALVLGN